MAIKMTENELAKLSFAVDPDNPTQAVPVCPEEEPSDSWSVERLMEFGGAAIKESGRLENEATVLARRSTVEIFRAGKALILAHDKLDGQTWGECLKSHNIPRTTAWEAMELFRRAKTEEAIRSMSISEAKHKFEITKPKPKPDPTPPPIPFPSSKNERPEPAEDEESDVDFPDDDDSEIETDELPKEPLDEPTLDDLDDDGESSVESESPGSVLAKITERLEYLEEDLDSLDLEAESPNELLRLVENARDVLTRIRTLLIASEKSACK